MKRVTSIAILGQRLERELQNLARKRLSLKQVAQLVKLQFVEPQKAPVKTLQTATWSRESIVALMELLDHPRNPRPLHNHLIWSRSVVVLPITAVVVVVAIAPPTPTRSPIHPNHPSFLSWQVIQSLHLRGRLLRFKETQRTESIVTVSRNNLTGID